MTLLELAVNQDAQGRPVEDWDALARAQAAHGRALAGFNAAAR